jgi:hypothetical protein
MRYALIDNSTLTGVQRLFGQIPIKNTLVTDMDVLCLESLVEAILFYDQIFVIDDYKPYFRNSRTKSFPFLSSLGPDSLPIHELTATTKKLTESIVPRVEGGQFTDKDFKPFFDLLKMNVTFTWDMASSVYFLTQKMLAGVGGLDIKKYSRLSSAIYGELIDKRRAVETGIGETKVVLVDSQGKPIGPDYEILDKENRSYSPQMSSQASAFFAALNWLAFRTIFYTLAARNLKIDLILHPIRHSFQANFIPKFFKGDTNTFKPLLDAMNHSANESINKILGNVQPFVTKERVPLFVTWLAVKTGDPARFIETALELRQEAPFVKARQKLIELEAKLAEGNFTSESNRLLQEVSLAMRSIVSKYGANTEQGISSSSIITLWNLTAALSGLPKIPNIKFQIPRSEFVKHIMPAKGFKAVYRTLVSDLVQVSQLGKYYEIITRRIVLEEGADELFAKEERAEFRRSKFYWKIPM